MLILEDGELSTNERCLSNGMQYYMLNTVYLTVVNKHTIMYTSLNQ